MLTPETTADSIAQLILDYLTGVDVIEPGDVSLDGDFEAMGADSLVLIELSVHLKNVYGIQLDLAQMPELRTVRDVAENVRSVLVSA